MRRLNSPVQGATTTATWRDPVEQAFNRKGREGTAKFARKANKIAFGFGMFFRHFLVTFVAPSRPSRLEACPQRPDTEEHGRSINRVKTFISPDDRIKFLSPVLPLLYI